MKPGEIAGYEKGILDIASEGFAVVKRIAEVSGVPVEALKTIYPRERHKMFDKRYLIN